MYRTFRPAAVAVLSSLVLGAGGSSASVSLELVASGLAYPVFAGAPEGDDRLFLVEQRGVIRIWEDGSLLAEPFLDIDSLVAGVSQFSERGLLGLAFHPDYASNGLFFVNYTNTSGTSVIARYETEAGNPYKADHASAEIVLTQAQPFANHNGGMLAFGPDGYLYCGLGDGGSAGDPQENGQNLGTLLGKMIRIDVDPLPYTSPPDNPFVDVPGALDPIWALGLRNPWRWSFDRTTGDLWIADVGQGAYEEVNRQSASSAGGENYGWDQMEGLHCYEPPTDCGEDSLDLPIHEYEHGDQHCSVTGGYVYRGALVPELEGVYLFGDYCSSTIWGLAYDSAGDSVASVTDLTAELDPGGVLGGVSSFGEDGAGELVVVSRGGGANGAVYRIVSDPTGVEEEGSLPSTFRLGRPEPNPFVDRTRFAIEGGRTSDAVVRVYNAAGRAVRTLAAELSPREVVEWDGRGDDGRALPAGVYFVRLFDGRESESRRVTLVR